MMLGTRPLRIAAALGIAIVGRAAAQFPGDHLTGANRARQEFLTNTLQAIGPVMTKWKEAMESDDPKAAADFFLTDGLYSSYQGDIIQGREAIESALTTMLPRMSGFRTVMLDFTASGSMVYQFGRFSYSLAPAEGASGAPTMEVGTFVIVLYLNGRDWKIRSYVERVDAIGQ